MSRVLFILILACINTAGFFSAACSPAAAQKLLTVGVIQEDNFPLVYFDAEDKPRGFEVEMVYKLARAGGFEINEIRRFSDRDSLLNALHNDQIDFAFSKIKKNAVDAERFIYAKPHLQVNYVFLLNRIVMAGEGIQIEPLQNLINSDLTVGTLESTLYTDRLKNSYPQIKTKVFRSKLEVFKAVAAGEIAACYMDEIEVKNYFISSPDKALFLQYLQAGERTDSIALVFPWDKLFLREWVNIFLVKEGYTRTQLQQVMKKYASHMSTYLSGNTKSLAIK